MKLALMRYKGFSFACNPLSLQIRDEINVSEQVFVSRGEKLEDLGYKLRKVKGKGELTGVDCLEQYANLVSLQKEKGAGVLSLPDIKPFNAVFTMLTASADVTPDTVFYEFEFLEEASFPKETNEEEYHTVNDGETLFDIGYIYKTDIQRLVMLNPQIRRPDELKKGEKVRIC